MQPDNSELSESSCNMLTHYTCQQQQQLPITAWLFVLQAGIAGPAVYQQVLGGGGCLCFAFHIGFGSVCECSGSPRSCAELALPTCPGAVAAL